MCHNNDDIRNSTIYIITVEYIWFRVCGVLPQYHHALRVPSASGDKLQYYLFQILVKYIWFGVCGVPL